MLITLQGGPASGKSTVAQELLKRHPSWQLFPSYTTRNPRPDQPDGEYNYISKFDFDVIRHLENFLWTTEFRGYKYGTKTSDVDEAICNDTWIAMLLPEYVLAVHERARCTVGAPSDPIRSFHLTVKVEEVRTRLEKRGISDEDVRLDLLRHKKIRQDSFTPRMDALPLFTIKNSGELLLTIEKIEEFLDLD